MDAKAPPTIFAPARRLASRHRAGSLSAGANAATYIIDDMVDDVLERLDFLRHAPQSALLIGDRFGVLASALRARGADVTALDAISGLDEEQPLPVGGFDFVASLSSLDTLNDPVGALVHLRRALVPGGLALACFVGAGSLDNLRAAMLAADGDRPAPRLHPMIDVRSGAQLLQRAGWANPVVDTRAVTVRYSSLFSLVADLRAQALGN